MNKFRVLFILAFGLCMIAAVLSVHAQEITPEPATPTADVILITETPVSTEIVIITPAADTETPTPTAEATEVVGGGGTDDQPKPFDITPFLPFIFGLLGVVALGVLAVFGLYGVLLFRSQPLAWAITKPLVKTGADKFGEYSKTTDALWDDAISNEFNKRWAEFEGKVDAKVESKVGAEVAKVVPNAVSSAVSNSKFG